MIIQSEFRLDEKRREILPSYSSEFPFVCLDACLDHFIGRGLHWHPAFEIDYVREGEADYEISNGKPFHLMTGEAVFINSNVMHTARSSRDDKKAGIYAFLFGGEFLAGIFGNQIDRRYLLPIIGNSGLSMLKIRPDSRERIRFMDLLLQLPFLAEQEPFGYEFKIRNILCEMWLILLSETEEVRKSSKPETDKDAGRIKEMLTFIHEHYMENISVRDIAEAAGVSERECSRCFRRSIQDSPSEYLNRFRVRMAAQLLLNTSESIFVISDRCGFHSNSYFGRVFKEMTGMTPHTYRKNRTI